MTGSGPQWRDVHDLVQESKRDILAAIEDIKKLIDDHETRIRSIENTAERRQGSQATATLFLGLPQRLVNLVASSVALVLSLIAVAAWLGKLG